MPGVFFLGTHMPGWLSRTDVPLFISRRRLSGRVTLPKAQGIWALDSGGFTELSLYGEWRTSPRQYVAEARRYRDEIGKLAFASPQDWMCEPGMLQRTGLTVAEHQERTVENLLHLRAAAPDVPWIPVLQGWHPEDYCRHVERYRRAGVDLSRERLVGVGSVCRRQALASTGAIFRELAIRYGLRLHGFGVKRTGLRRYSEWLVSADSLAWSFAARWQAPLPGCPHASCANCLRFALQWRDGLPAEWLSDGHCQHVRRAA